MKRSTPSVVPAAERRPVFERLLFELSTQFVVVKLNAEELSAAIEEALGKVNGWLGVAGSAIGRVSADAPTANVLFCTPEGSTALDSLLADAEAVNVIRAGNDLHVALPRESALGRSLEGLRLDGLLVLPLSMEEQEITYLACWWIGVLDLSPVEVSQLRMVGELTLAALHRHDAETRQTELEEKLRQGSKLQSLGLLAGGVAHDFNNILTVIRGCSEIAMRDPNLSSSLSGYLSEITAASDQAIAMARKLLTFGRQGVTVGNPVAINDVVGQLQRLLLRLLRGNVDLRLELTEDSSVVAASVSDLEQVIMNLCINAGEAMPDGGDLCIRTRQVTRQSPTGSRARTYVELSVVDVGHGMTPQQAATIFDPFFTTKAFGEGAGLGLSVVHGIVTQLEGFAEVESEPGAGTEMRIYLPCVNAEPERVSISSVTVSAGTDATILIVDDLPGLCMVMSRTLETAGYRTLFTSKPDAALELFSQHRAEVSLVILDLIMPSMGGRDIYDQFAEHSPDLPVLFVSGYTGNTLPASYLERRNMALLFKPFTGEQLLGAVRRLLNANASAMSPATGPASQRG